MIKKGVGLNSMIMLLFWVTLDVISRRFIGRLPSLRRYVEYIKDRVARKVIINLNGLRFRLVDSDSLCILSPEFEKWMQDYLSSLGSGDVFLDVGAHIGKYTIPAAKRVGRNGLVIAIEPHPENYKTLTENIKLNDLNNVIALNIAAWKEEGILKLFIGDTHGRHSVKRCLGLGYVEVRAKALDEVIDQLKVRRVNLIKIDVEGAELEVLKGLARTLEKYRPTVIVEV